MENMDNSRNRLNLSQQLSAAPFVAISTALACGIGVGKLGCGLSTAVAAGALAALTVAILQWISLRSPGTKIAVRGYYWIPALTAFFGIGVSAWHFAAAPCSIPDDANHVFVTAHVADVTTTSSGDRLIIDVICFNRADGAASHTETSFRAIVYSGVTPIHRGDVVRFRNFLEPSGEYAIQGIEWRQNVPPERIVVIDHAPTLIDRAADLRDLLVTEIDRTPLNQETKSFLQAVILGDKAQLDPQLRDDFASAGVAHLLALSGMHLGMVAMLLSVALIPFSFIISRKWRWLIVLSGVWIFTVVTGMSVSVVRAAVMTTVFVLAMLVERKRSGINTLCAAAFFILFFDPQALFNIGFQLSFITCAALITLSSLLAAESQRHSGERYLLIHSDWAAEHPKLLRLRLAATSRLRRLGCICAVSIAAFASSWILSAYYFHQIPLLFLPSNLVSGIIVSLIFAASALYFPIYALCLPAAPVGNILDTLCSALSSWCSLMARLSNGWTGEAYVNDSAPWLYLISLAAFAVWLTLRRDVWLWSAVTTMAVCLFTLIAIPARREPAELAVTLSKGEPHIVIRQGYRSITVPYQRGANSAAIICGHHVIMADCDLPATPADTTEAPQRMASFGLGSPYAGCDLLVVGRNCHTDIDTLLMHCHPACIVVGRYEDETARAQLDSIAACGIAVHYLADSRLTLTAR